MRRKKGDPGLPGAGRPKGAVNKTTADVRTALEEAFEKRGGVPALVQWAEASPDEFYKLWGKLLPKDVTLSGSGEPIRIIVQTGVIPPDTKTT